MFQILFKVLVFEIQIQMLKISNPQKDIIKNSLNTAKCKY